MGSVGRFPLIFLRRGAEEPEDLRASSWVSPDEADDQAREYGNYDSESKSIKEDCSEDERQSGSAGSSSG